MKNILIVDDDEDILSLVSDVVKRWGFNPMVARNGKEGLEKFKEHPVDLVLTDMRMPEMDGMALLEQIRGVDKKAPLIVLTGYPSLDTAIQAIRDGAYDYLVKPINMDELKFKIERCLERKDELRALSFLKGLNWALIISIPVWLILGIILARLLR